MNEVLKCIELTKSCKPVQVVLTSSISSYSAPVTVIIGYTKRRCALSILSGIRIAIVTALFLIVMP